MNLEIDLGFKCNLKCSYCIMTGSKYKETNIDKLINWINNSSHGVEEIRFIGGEPSLHLDSIVNIVDKIHKKIKSIHIITNGTKITDVIHTFKDINENYGIRTNITISIDRLGYDENRNYNMDSILTSVINETDDIISHNIMIDINRVIVDQTKDEIDVMNTIISHIPILNGINDLKLMNSNGLVDNSNFTHNCNLNCNSSVFIRNDKIYFCKLVETFHEIGLISSMDDMTLDDLILKRSNMKPIQRCMFDGIGRNKNEKEKGV
ncbi:MAG: radical SAM protein [Peptostreptococcaceae bacterium]